MPDEKLYSVAGAEDYIAHYPTATRRVDEVVVHHCWRPAAGDYNGEGTIRGVRRYHMTAPPNGRGWSDNGYHWMLAPNGDVWRCRPMIRSGAHVSGRNAHTVGVSFVANFDSDDPAAYGGMDEGYRVVAALLKRFDLGVENIRFHREFANKTCPGNKLGLVGFRAAVAAVLGDEDSGTDPEPDPPALDVDEWAQEAVDFCRREGLMVGYPDGLFHGRDGITRQEVAVVVQRLDAHHDARLCGEED